MNAVSANSNYKAEALKVLQLMNTDAKFRNMCAFECKRQLHAV